MTDEQNRPCCVLCGVPLSEREQELCLQQRERFDDQLLCLSHQRRFSGCPGVRGQRLP